jgi:hypothetical protein
MGYDNTNITLKIESGNFTVDGALNVTSTIYATGNITGNSDIREKVVLDYFEDGLNTLMQLKPIYYYRKERPAIMQYGFSAQEVHALYPDIGRWDENLDKYGIDYMGMIAWNTVAIQDLKNEKEREVNELKKRIEILEREVLILKN